MIVIKSLDKNVAVNDVTLMGKPAKIFSYEVGSSKNSRFINEYYQRLTPRISLKVKVNYFKNLKDKELFLNEVDKVLESIIIDVDEIEKRGGMK